MNSNVIFFDGICNLCNSSINYILDHDKKGVFKFSSLQSQYYRTISDKMALPTQFDTIFLISNDKVYYKSSAVLMILFKLPYYHKLAIIFFIFPKFIRDKIYDYVAKNRYKWFGKSDNCRVPSKETLSKFID